MFDKNRILELYDRQIKKYPAENPFIHLSSQATIKNYGKYLNELLKQFGGKISVADLGCAVGNMLRYVDKNQIDYNGFDINENFITRAKKLWQDYSNLKFNLYDISDCDLPRNFDVILVNETFSYFNEYEIISMINYYVNKADKLFSTSILIGKNYPPELLITENNPYKIVKHVLENYKGAVVNRAIYPKKLRIEIWKGGFTDV